MPDPTCTDARCIHAPGYVIGCGYDQDLGLASVGPGWASLVREAFAAVGGYGRVVQVKQKLGELRIHAVLDGPDADILARLDALTLTSRTRCQRCGARRMPGDRLGRCPACASA